MGHNLNTVLDTLVLLLSLPNLSSPKLHNHEMKQSEVLSLASALLPGGRRGWCLGSCQAGACGCFGESPQMVRGIGKCRPWLRGP
jgi:hypothetical protein